MNSSKRDNDIVQSAVVAGAIIGIAGGFFLNALANRRSIRHRLKYLTAVTNASKPIRKMNIEELKDLMKTLADKQMFAEAAEIKDIIALKQAN